MDRDLNIRYQVFETGEDLEADEQQLLAQAWQATDNAYAPYSGFKVGCAVLIDDERILIGANQENNSFPIGNCAEKSAFATIGSNGLSSGILKVAIRSRSVHRLIDQPAMPCGSCRQFMAEYERNVGREFVLLSQGETGQIIRLVGIEKNLLPLGFDIDLGL